MQNGNDTQRLFIRRISNQIFAHKDETQGPLGEVRAFLALAGKRNYGANGCQNFRDHPVGGVEIVRANKFPNLVQVDEGLGVEVVSGHEPEFGERRAAALFSRKWASTFSPEIGFNLPLFRSS